MSQSNTRGITSTEFSSQEPQLGKDRKKNVAAHKKRKVLSSSRDAGGKNRLEKPHSLDGVEFFVLFFETGSYVSLAGLELLYSQG